MEYRRTTLANGIRLLVSEMPEARSVSIAIYVGVGSRMEDRDTLGSDHFLEHMVFKGTAKRPTPGEISKVIEGVGGVVNASTDKESTVFWSRVPARAYLVALDVLADMLRAPMLRQADVESERRVVIEEIRMNRDQPQDRVHTLLEELLYPRHPLGWEIAGTERVVSAITAEGLRRFLEANYSTERTVIAICGKLDAAEAERAVGELFGDMRRQPPRPFKKAPQAGKLRLKALAKRSEQAHFCIGWRGVAQDHPDKYSLDMLNAVLGDGMSSRLFLELREDRGLAYDVHSFSSNFSDAGHVVVYAGVAPDRVDEAMRVALHEIARLRDEAVPAAELGRVRDYNKGRIELRLENSQGVASWLASQELFLGRVRTVDEVCAIIDSISAADIQRVARQYLRPELAYVAAVGSRAALGNVRLPGADNVVMEKAS